jgi:hypothetical protein
VVGQLSPDGRTLVVGGADGLIRTWHLDFEWIFLDELLVEAERTFSSGSSIWPRTPSGTLDAWLDVWRDLDRCGSMPTATASQRQRLQAIRGLWIEKVGDRFEGSTRSLAAQLGTSTWANFQRWLRRVLPFLAPTAGALLANPLYRAGLVDPELAADLAERLGSSREDVLRFSWPRRPVRALPPRSPDDQQREIRLR